MTRRPAGRLASASTISPETCGKRPLAAGSIESPFSIARRSAAPLISSVTARLPNGSSFKTSRRLIVSPARVNLAAADAAAVEDRDVGMGIVAHSVGDEIADRGLARAHGDVAAIELGRGGGERHVEFAAQYLLEAGHRRCHFRIGVTVAVSMMRNCGHQLTVRLLPSVFTSIATSTMVTYCAS